MRESISGDVHIVEIPLGSTPDLARVAALAPERYPFLLESSAGAAAQSRFDMLLGFPGDTLTVTAQDAHTDFFAALDQRAGGLTILPIAARRGREAGRVLVVARKGARAPLRLLAPFVMHQSDRHSADREDLTPAAQAVLREGAPIAELFAKVP